MMAMYSGPAGTDPSVAPAPDTGFASGATLPLRSPCEDFGASFEPEWESRDADGAMPSLEGVDTPMGSAAEISAEWDRRMQLLEARPGGATLMPQGRCDPLPGLQCRRVISFATFTRSHFVCTCSVLPLCFVLPFSGELSNSACVF
jgi:hypothetical protein